MALSGAMISMRGVNPLGSAPRLQAIDGCVPADSPSVCTAQLGTTTTLICRAAECFDDDGPFWPVLDACDRAAPQTTTMATAAATECRTPLFMFRLIC